ncbi:transcription-repair coupling factor [Clostridium sp. CAG:1000]|nr:transcription-repair coupling factor [Clostridium sp. CAG:1000]
MIDILCKKLFDFDINNIKNVSISDNEIYNQFILYTFFSSGKNIMLVFPTLNEATEKFNNLKSYLDDVYLFPEDDIISKSAIAASPELLYMRINLLNKINDNKQKIVIVHLNSYIKKMSNIQAYRDKTIHLKKNKIVNREKLIKDLTENGYKRESMVYNTSDFSVRGFVIDVYPVGEENPVRIELFDDVVEKIKYFDPITQKTMKELDEVSILSLNENYNDSESSIKDYLENKIVMYHNFNQIKLQEKMLKPQMEYLNISSSVFKLNELLTKDDIYLDTINNKNKDINIFAKNIEYYNSNKSMFIDDIIKNNGTLYSSNKNFINEILHLNNKIKTVNKNLNKGFVYKNKYYYSENDLYGNNKTQKIKYKENIGKNIISLDNLQIGDYVVHRKNGIGIYKGITTIEKNKLKKDYILIQYKGNDKLYLPVEDISKLYKYVSKEGMKPTINKLNSIEWTKTKLRIREKIKNITQDLLKIYKEREKAIIKPFSKDDENQIIFENEFEYEETPDQIKAINEIKKDLEKPRPMERLLCGDVGYGKTEVIFRAMFKAVENNYQVAYLCPTTILSYQQYESAKERFRNFAINIDIINRHYTNKQVQAKIKKLKEGKTDIIFGTHRLLSKDVEYNNLGLLVIDEEHRFGVEQKEKIKKIKSNVHVLSVSATPIPRSLQMSLVGIRDLSLIESAPQNRYPVQTYVIEYNEMLIREVILKEISRKGQAFILYNNVMNMINLVNKYKRIIPEAKICYAHGKMTKKEMQDIIYDFTNKKYDVLVSTTIIENGIDIPNANTIIVIDSDRFGLSQLYQIRGRVGRSDKIAYAYLMYKKEKILTLTAKKRLEAIKEFTELGSGYKISMRDLAIRGAGDLLGKEQAGFIDSVGVNMYLDLIKEEVEGTKEEDIDSPKEVMLNVPTHIGNEYTDDSDVVIELHKKINAISSKTELNSVLEEIKDRFGITNQELQLYAHEKYIEKLVILDNVKISENDNKKIVLRLLKSSYKDISIEELFIKTINISGKFNFLYKNDSIYITLLKTTLEKNYLYYIEELLELIYILKSKNPV